jgi:hypothetical protein
MAAFLWRMMGEPPVATPHGFSDVFPSNFFEPAVRWLKAKGITTGYGSPTTFSPGANVTRGEMAAFLWRMAGQPNVTEPHGFTDITASYQEVPVRWLKKFGITTGYGGSSTRFAPNEPVTRGQMAAFLYRLSSVQGAWNLPSTQQPPTVTYR